MLNILFEGKTYEELFHLIYDDIANEYNLEIVKSDNTSMELKSDLFVLSVSYDIDTVWIYYYNIKTGKTHLLSNYINTSAEDIDRNDLPRIDTIAKNLERTLMIQSRVLKRKFKNLLEGKIDWFEDYKNCKFYSEINM